MNQFYLIKILIPYFKSYKKELIIGSFLTLLMSILILPTPLISKYIIDTVIVNKNMHLLKLSITALIALLIISNWISYVQSNTFYKVNNRVIMELRIDLLNKIHNIPLAESKKFGQGYLISRINDDTIRIKSLFVDTIISLCKDLFTFIVGTIVIFYINWKMALIAVIILPIFAISMVYFGKIIKSYSAALYESESETTQQLNENIKMIEVCKMFLFNKYSINKYTTKAENSLRNSISLGKVVFFNSSITGTLSQLAPIIIIAYGGYEIMNSRLTIGDLVAFNSFLAYLFGPTSRFINLNVQIQQSMVSLKRIFEILSLPEEKNHANFMLPEKIDQLHFSNLNFKYYNSNKEILKNLNFNLNSGDRVGIVGFSGGGKTTLIKAISGLYEMNDGKIELNGFELKKENLFLLRNRIAIVEQEPMLFNDTIFNNILYGNPSSNKEELIRVSKLANVDEFAESFKDRYETVIGVGGIELSIGQKQRIALARALLKKPDILLLDEVTSNIDPISEKYILSSIFSLPEDISIVMVTHRMDVAQACNKICVMKNGEIISEGNHNELLKNSKLYKELNKRLA